MVGVGHEKLPMTQKTAVRTSQRTHPKLHYKYGQVNAFYGNNRYNAYCENHTEHTNTLWVKREHFCYYNSWHQLYQLSYEESNKKRHADFHEMGIIYKSVATD
jgi:hypothetical protein